MVRQVEVCPTGLKFSLPKCVFGGLKYLKMQASSLTAIFVLLVSVFIYGHSEPASSDQNLVYCGP